MIRRLRRRVILVALAGLLLASAGLVAAINWMNWNSLEQQAGQVLDMLAENNGQRPAADGAEGQRPVKPEGTQPPDRGPGEMKNKKNRGSKAVMNAASMTNYYTAIVDEAGQVLSWHSDRTDLYTDAEIADMALWAVQAGKDRGRNDTRFYCLTEKDGEKLLIVVDSRLEIQNAESVLRLTVLVAVIEDALLSVGAVWLIRRLVQPVDEAMEKQKQFVWDASHELKTPLAVISANADVLAAEAGESKPLQYIQSEVRRTDSLIQNLLTLARMEKGTVEAVYAKFDLSRALLEVALPFESAVFEEGKTLEMDIPEGVEYTGDGEMIKQLAVILLSNAQKYSDEKGKIRIALEAKGDKRILRVHNTGPAIPPEAQPRIFDRFYRVDSSHNREVEGNGLGLAIAQSIVTAHRGKITVHSAEGEGTEFTVIL